MVIHSPDAKRPHNAAFFLPSKKYLTACANASRIASNDNATEANRNERNPQNHYQMHQRCQHG